MDKWQRIIIKLRYLGQLYYNRAMFTQAVESWRTALKIENACKSHYFPYWETAPKVTT